MLKDILGSVFRSVYERTNSPIIGSFVVTWSIFNYKFWLIFFSELGINLKLQNLDAFIENQSFHFLISYPLVATFLYVLGYPYLRNVVSYLSLHAKNWGNRLLGRHLDENYVPASELVSTKDKMREEIRLKEEAISRSEQRILGLNETIAGNKELIDKLSKEKDGFATRFAEIEEKYSELENQAPNAQTRLNLKSIRELESIEDLKGPLNEVSDDHALLQHTFRLFYNPHETLEKNKVLGFMNGGKLTGKTNNNEFAWRISEGHIELLDSSDNAHSRFYFDSDNFVFRSTNDPDLGAIIKHKIKDQFLALEDFTSISFWYKESSK